MHCRARRTADKGTSSPASTTDAIAAGCAPRSRPLRMARTLRAAARMGGRACTQRPAAPRRPRRREPGALPLLLLSAAEPPMRTMTRTLWRKLGHRCSASALGVRHSLLVEGFTLEDVVRALVSGCHAGPGGKPVPSPADDSPGCAILPGSTDHVPKPVPYVAHRELAQAARAAANMVRVPQPPDSCSTTSSAALSAGSPQWSRRATRTAAHGAVKLDAAPWLRGPHDDGCSGDDCATAQSRGRRSERTCSTSAAALRQ